MKKFLIERSPTPIYQRIIQSFKKSLEKYGHKVIVVNPDDFLDDETKNINFQAYINYINQQNSDYFLVTNLSSKVVTYLPNISKFLFELIENKIIFVHHDNVFINYRNKKNIFQLLESFHLIKDRSFHFCIEYYNFLDLKELGIQNTYLINHASEFNYLDFPEIYQYDLSFVGHLLPYNNELEHLPLSHVLMADFWKRMTLLNTSMEKSAIKFSRQIKSNSNNRLHQKRDFFVNKYFYLSLLHTYSQFFRGELVKRITASYVLDIIGGDPAYLHNVEINRKIERNNIKYHRPTKNYADTANIYANSKINLNITSLQFDQAVINRVIDVASVGGFILTDWKADLSKLTSVAKEISYETIDELNYKIDYYLNHEQERLEIAYTLHKDIKKHCTYDQVVDFIMSKVTNVSESNFTSETIYLDLGCGKHKEKDFIGVDCVANDQVDVVADLNNRFPFAKDSVDFIKAHDIIEHLQDRIHTMNEIWRISKPNAIIDIRVPSTDGRGAFQDPTHISFWNLNSFMYYCQEFPAYLELCQTYGFEGKFSIISLQEEKSENNVIHVNAKLKVIKSPDNSYIEQLNLREINLIIFPDWHQSMDLIFNDLVKTFKDIINHPQKNKIKLLIDTQNANLEESEFLLGDVLMYLCSQEEIEIDENDVSEFSLLNISLQEEYQSLLPFLYSRIILEHENTELIAQMKLEDLSSLTREKLRTIK
ncbi:MAG: glycosyltransferase [Moorea sp. SIO2B7]|nr:glycosyltransferase [Moorena sp. SIO2B7]